jgi:PhzF family phenazine biosynthesis protein
MRIRTIDAFANQPFQGNPAGVCLLSMSQWPDETWMEQVAAELNHSDTAFAFPMPPGADADWALRWFTPTGEVNLCGHATLATAHALFSDDLLRNGRVRFATKSGVLTANVTEDGEITLDFPVIPTKPISVPEGASEALGVSIVACWDTGAFGALVAEVADEETVRNLAPDAAAIEGLEAKAVVVTAPADDAARGYDFVSRVFAPAMGISEDPVTGSAHTALVHLWSARLNRSELTGFQVSPRSGLVRTQLKGDRVLLTGRAVTVLDGTLFADPPGID